MSSVEDFALAIDAIKKITKPTSHSEKTAAINSFIDTSLSVHDIPVYDQKLYKQEIWSKIIHGSGRISLFMALTSAKISPIILEVVGRKCNIGNASAIKTSVAKISVAKTSAVVKPMSSKTSSLSSIANTSITNTSIANTSIANTSISNTSTANTSISNTSTANTSSISANAKNSDPFHGIVSIIDAAAQKDNIIERQRFRIRALYDVTKGNSPSEAISQLWQHVKTCTEGKDNKPSECKIIGCISSKYILSHYANCKNRRTCDVCSVIPQSNKSASSSNATLISSASVDMVTSSNSDSIDMVTSSSSASVDMVTSSSSASVDMVTSSSSASVDMVTSSSSASSNSMMSSSSASSNSMMSSNSIKRKIRFDQIHWIIQNNYIEESDEAEFIKTYGEKPFFPGVFNALKDSTIGFDCAINWLNEKQSEEEMMQSIIEYREEAEERIRDIKRGMKLSRKKHCNSNSKDIPSYKDVDFDESNDDFDACDASDDEDYSNKRKRTSKISPKLSAKTSPKLPMKISESVLIIDNDHRFVGKIGTIVECPDGKKTWYKIDIENEIISFRISQIQNLSPTTVAASSSAASIPRPTSATTSMSSSSNSSMSSSSSSSMSNECIQESYNFYEIPVCTNATSSGRIVRKPLGDSKFYEYADKAPSKCTSDFNPDGSKKY